MKESSLIETCSHILLPIIAIYPSLAKAPDLSVLNLA